MDKPDNWESIIIDMERRTGKEFFLCDIDRNEECNKAHCFRYGGECFLTTKEKYAKEVEV